MNLISSLSNCSQYYYGDNLLITLHKDCIICDDKKIIGEFYTFSCIENILSCYDNMLEKTLFYDIKTHKIVHSTDFCMVLDTKLSNVYENYFWAQYDDDENEYSVKVNKNTFQIIDQYPINYGLNGIMKILENDNFLSRGRQVLNCYVLSTGEQVWECDYKLLLGSDRPSQIGELIVFDDKLFIFLQDFQGNSGTFCLDVRTGEVLHKLPNFEGVITQFGAYIYVANLQKFKRLNPENFEVTVYDLQPILEPHGWELNDNKFVVEGDLLYFVHQEMRGGGEAIVGIINLKTNQLEWHTKITIEEGSYWIQEIRVVDNRLYVHTQGKTLYIFEKV